MLLFWNYRLVGTPKISVALSGMVCGKLSESLLGVLLDRHVASDFHGSASCRLCNEISAFRWGLAHFASLLRFHNEDNRQCSLPWHLPALTGFFPLLYHCIPFLTTTHFFKGQELLETLIYEWCVREHAT